MKKLLLSLFLGLLMSLSALTFIACGNNESYNIVVDGEVVQTVELGSMITIPSAHLVDDNNQAGEGKVEIMVTNPHNVIVTTSAMDIKAKLLGEYKITYSYKNSEKVEYTVKSQDTAGPVINATDIIYNMYKGEEVKLPNIEVEDVSDVKLEDAVLKVFYKSEPNTPYTISNMRTFVPDKTGTYVYYVEVCDEIGNKSIKQWEFYVADKTWVDESATGMTLASFNSDEYINVFGAGTATDRQGHPDVEILDEYKGETGVAKVTMNYFDHNFGNYSSVNIRFPRTYTYEQDKRVAIKIRMEDSSIDLDKLNLFQYEHTHVYAVGVDLISSYIIKEGEWATIVLSNGVLSRLKEEDGTIKGLQLDVKQSPDHASSIAQVFYIASIAEIEQLAKPENVRVSGSKAVWNAVANAKGYLVQLNDTETVVNTTEIDLPQGAYSLKVKALGDGAYYEDSPYSDKLTNMLDAPTGLSMSATNVLSWNAVANAQGYLLDINGTEHSVTTTTFNFNEPADKNYVIKVKAKGDGSIHYDSEYAGITVRNIAPPEGYVADFADQTYVYDMQELNVSTGDVKYDFRALDFEAEWLETYDGANGVLKTKITAGLNGWAMVSLKLPKTLTFDTLYSMTIKFRVEGVDKGGSRGMRVYGLGDNMLGMPLVQDVLSDQINGWFTVTCNVDDIKTGYSGSATGDYILFGFAEMPAETDFYLYLDEITEVRRDRLATPTNLKTENGVLTWDAVTNATGYVVIVNGEEEKINTNSYQLPETNYSITVKAVAEDYIESYESEAITKRQEVIGELAAALTESRYAKYDDERYVYCVENKAVNGQTVNVEIIDDVKGEKGKVLHISGDGNFNQIILHLPKTITGNFAIDYRMKTTAMNESTYYWQIMTATGGWDHSAFQPVDVDEWTTYAIDASAYGYVGSNQIIIGTNAIGSFDLYITMVYDATAELVSKLGTNELARFDESSYAGFVKQVGPNTITNYKVEIVEDVKGVKGKVLHISGVNNGFNILEITLLKNTTGVFKFDYRMQATPSNNVSTNYWEVMTSIRGWSTLPFRAASVDSWTTYDIASWYGYANTNKLYIGLNDITTFDLYISIVYDVPSV